MEALRRHLGLGPIVTIGTSYGGMVAMAHAARYPDAVSHLVLVVTAAHGGFIPRAQADRGGARHARSSRRVCETLWAGRLRYGEKLRDYYDVMGPLYSRALRPGGRGGRRGARDPLARGDEPRLRAGRLPAQLRPAAGACRASPRRR